MAVKHFAEGSIKPNLIDEAVYLFSMRFCPYAHRAHLVLSAKNVKHETIYINLSSKPNWFLEIFPPGRVPALIYNKNLFYESGLLADFLNDEFPENPLYPPEPLKKFKDKISIENFSKVSSTFYKTAMVEFTEENFNELLKCLDETEHDLSSRKTRYFGGNDKPMMVDYIIWPWFERFPALPILFGENFKLSPERFPALIKYTNLMMNDPHVQKHYLTGEQHAKHYTLRKSDDPGAFDNVIE